jgi:hypothetical protein
LEQHLEDSAEPSPDPEEMLLISHNRDEVRRALEQLPAEFRGAIVPRELEELSCKDIANGRCAACGRYVAVATGQEWLRRILSSVQEGLS